METRLEEWLSELIRICQNPSPSLDAATQVQNRVKNVRSLFNDDAVAEDVEDLMYAALFAEEEGILKFIQDASPHKVYGDAISVAFDLIINLIEVNKRDKIKKYALHIEEFGWRFWMVKETSIFKEEALKVLISLYEYSVLDTTESQFTIRLNKLTSELSKEKNNQANVLQLQFHLLGILCKKYPEKIQPKSECILNIFLYRLERQVEKKATSYLTVLKGRFEGLSEFLYVFPLNHEDTAKQILLNDVIKHVVLDRDTKSKTAHRAALKLLRLHGSQFSKQIIKDCKLWHYNLWCWVKSKNVDDSRAGNFALEKFYQVISKELLEIETNEGKAIYEDLIKKIKEERSWRDIAVAGYGFLSAPAKVLFGPEKVSELFSSVKSLIKNKFFRSEGSFQPSVQLLPIYMETLSEITGNLDHVTLDQVAALQEVAVHLIENYPNFPQMQKYQCAEALIFVAHHLISKGSLVNVFLEKVLYQGLIRSCSFPSPMYVELIKDDLKVSGLNAPVVTGCLDYVPFWKELFGPTRSKIIVDKGMDAFVYNNIKGLLFDHFISSIMVILDRLDLTLIKEDHSGVAGNISVGDNVLRSRNEFGLASSTPKDFIILYNLVAIIFEVFPALEIHMIDKYLDQIIMGIIDHSEKLPLISGFYKLLESCLHISISLKYFEDTESQTESMGSGPHKICNYEKQKLFTKLKQFLQNMLFHMKHYTNDLKLSCLRVILATPTPIIKIILPHLVSPMKSVFEIGNSLYKLADDGIAALERWTLELPFDDWDPVLRQILPSLDSFVKIGVHHVNESSVSLSMEKLSKASTSRRKYLIAKKRFESRSNEKDMISRYQLQRKCLLFLGHLPPSTAQAFIADESDSYSEHGMAWDTEYHLPFSIPFPKMHLSIYIDKFLPRIVDLSLTSSDRSTRITACELLHAFIMYLLGKGIQLEYKNGDQLSKLVERLMPSLLQLGCYPDDTAKNLFHKLLLSLAHWYSRKKESKEVDVWINALMDGLCDPHNAAIRELSAVCLKEYVESMLSGTKERKSSLKSLEKILENICNFSLHSNQYRRIGAAMALNNLCPVLREEDSIVSEFWFELLYCQVIGMEMCDNEGSPAYWLMSSSVHHLEEVFKLKANIFNKNPNRRRMPPGFQGVLLKDLVFWLLTKIGSIGGTCRRECMRLFLSLAPSVNGYSSPQNFVGKLIEEQKAAVIIEICERNLTTRPSRIFFIGTSEDEFSRKDLLLLLDWLNSLFTSLQCYVWIFENNLVKPSDIFLKGGSHKVLSRICEFLSSMDNFNDNIFDALSEMSLPSSSFLQEANGEVCLSPTVCGVSLEVFKFLFCLHRDSSSNPYVQYLLGRLWTPSLWNLITNIIFKENIRSHNESVLETLQKVLKGLLEVILNLPANLRGSFPTVMDTKLEKVSKRELEHVQYGLNGDKLYILVDFVNSLLFLQGCSPLNFKWAYMSELEESNLLQNVFDALFANDGDEAICVSLNQAKVKYLESLLKLSLSLNLKVEHVIALITNDTKVETKFSESNMTKGEHFLMCFKPCLISYLFLDLKCSLDSLLKHLLMNKRDSASNTIMNIIKDLFSDKRMKQRHVDNSFISSCLSSHWNSLRQLAWMDKWSSRALELLLAIYVGIPGSAEIIRGNKDITLWCVELLNSRKCPFDKKAKILELLPCLLSDDDERNIDVRNKLQELYCQYLSSGGETLSLGQTTKNTDLEMMLQRLLIAIEITGCPMLLTFFINVSEGGRRIVNHEHLDKSLTAVTKRSNADHQLKLINAAYEAAKNENIDECICLGAVKHFICRLIKISDQNAVDNFYKMHINFIDQTLGESFKSKKNMKVQLVSKIVCLQLVEIMFVCLHKRLEEPNCPIVLMDKNEKLSEREMIQKFMKRCLLARKSVALKIEEHNNLLRRYRCAAYNTAVAIVANLKRETKYYKYLFEEKLESGERLWEGLVDTSVKIHLQRSFEKEPEMVPVEAPICEGVESRKRKWNQSFQSSVRLTTQEFLSDSTLCEDITKFDYQNCSVKNLCRTMRELNDGDDVAMEDMGRSKPALIMHENDPANDHECMTAVTSLIKHLITEEILPSDDNPEDFDWLNSIKEAISFSGRHNNVKIFLVRVILNCEEELASHAEKLMVPIMTLVAEGCLGNDINYLITDVIQMLLAWNEKHPDMSLPNAHVTGIFNFFALKAKESRKEIFRGYMGIIRSMYVAWKDLIEIPYDEILDKCMEKDSMQLGLFLSRLFLEHSKVPWRPEDKQRFFQCLLKNFSTSKNDLPVRLMSAHVIGQVLRTMDPEENGENIWGTLEENDQDFTSSIIKCMQGMLTSNEKDNFLKYIKEIQLNYSCIADEFLSHILGQLPKLNGKLHTMGMAIVCSRVEKLERPFMELKDKGLELWLKTNIPEDQQIALKMVMKSLPKLQEKEILQILDSILSFHSHSSVDCRKIMYEILIWIFDNFCLSDWEQTPDVLEKKKEELDQSWTDKCAKTLLYGLVDEEKSIQSRVCSFFEEKPGLKPDDPPSARFITIVDKLYSPATEASFLGYALTLLLSPSTSTPKYSELLFEHPLADCTFEDYQPRTSHRTFNLEMSPMFTESLVSSMTQMDLNSQQQVQKSSVLFSDVRSSQRSLAFSSTQGTFFPLSGDHSFSAGTSSNVDSVDGESALANYFIPREKAFKRPHELKRRRYLNTPKNRSYYAAIENMKSTQRMEMAKERIVKRDAEITLHRKFRVGDFPDIQIHCYDILQPLCAIAKRDPVIAQQLFVSLFNGIMKQEEISGDKFQFMVYQDQSAFQRILKNTNQFSSPLLSAILEIAISHINYFPLNVDSVMKAIGPSGLSPLACLFLEARLNQWLPEKHTKLYDRSQANKDKEIWLQLATMYQGMEEYDVVHGIFHDMMGCGHDVKEALEYERSGQWASGKTAFRKILKTWAHSSGDDNTEYIERDYYFTGYFKCLESLSQWSDLNKVIMKQLGNSFEEAWSDEVFWIPWLMKSQINTGLEREINAKAFFDYISTSIKEEYDKRIYLQSNHSRELALIHSMFEEYDWGRNYVRKYYDSFLEDWPHLSPLSTKIKTPKLLSTQLTSELSLFLSAMKNHEPHRFNKDLSRLCSIWKANLPNRMEPLSHWEHRIACRRLFIRKMVIADVGGETGIDEERIDLEKVSAQMALSLVDMAIHAQNFHVAENYLKKSEASLQVHADSALRLQWHISQAFLPWVEGLNNKSDRAFQLKKSVEAWDQLAGIFNDPELSLSPTLHLSVIQKVYTVSKTVHRVIKMNPADIDSMDCSIKANIFRLLGDSITSTPSLTERIAKYGVNQLEDSVGIAKKQSKSCIADQYLELAKYCQYLMEDTPEKYEEICLKAILRAMAYGSQQARQWFPRILQLSGLYSSLSGLFIIESSRVPLWMYLSWTNQILAHLKDSTCSTLSHLVVPLAEAYPSAIVFPFRISSDKYQQEKSEAMRALTNRLDKILFKNQLLEKFLESLKYVCVPLVMLQSLLARTISLLESTNPIMEEVEKSSSLMLAVAFPEGRGRKVTGAQYFGKLINELQGYEQEIRRTMAVLPSIKDKSQEKALLNKLNGINNKLLCNNRNSQGAFSKELKDYSLWLSEFRSSGQGDYLEIPGQYTGDCEPRVEEHVKIVGFHPKVVVMRSLRKPICITLIGSDAKEYKFLIKYGEDLRLDQRIEQLFGIMNKILAMNPTTQERKLCINTYQVIPMASNLGMIEWVDNTSTLAAALSLSTKGKEAMKRRGHVCDAHQKWIKGAGQHFRQPYADAFHKYGREETIKSYKKKAESFPCDMLRSSLVSLSLSLESFWSLRNTFTTSYATLCIAHWLLGIGDRHTSNLLISMTTGRVIGIDFGYSFGTSTQALAVPELMLFRLTPQIMGLMQPCGEVGLMKETMIHTLRALQENHDILLSTMDVFVKEPSVDWMAEARKQAKRDGVSGSELEENYLAYPKKKILIARRKFVGGTNPREITVEELSSRKTDAPVVLSKLKELATGHPTHNIRATLPALGLSCEQQVSCLMDQATDYHILGKTWEGWEPWL